MFQWSSQESVLLVKHAINLSALVGGLGVLIQASASRKVQFRSELAGYLPLIEADAGELHWVIMNLIISGAEAIDENVGFSGVRHGASNRR
jgi:hypothetical protein